MHLPSFPSVVAVVALLAAQGHAQDAEEPMLEWKGVWPQFTFPNGGPKADPPPPPGTGDIVSQNYPPAPPPPKAPPPPPPPPNPAQASEFFASGPPAPGGSTGGSGSGQRFKSQTFVETQGDRQRARKQAAALAASRLAAAGIAQQLRGFHAADHGHHSARKGVHHQQALGPAFVEESSQPGLRGSRHPHAAHDAMLRDLAAALEDHVKNLSAYKVQRSKVGGDAASFLETAQRNLPPWSFASPFAGLGPHQYRYDTVPGPTNAHDAPWHVGAIPSFLPLGSIYGPDKVAPPAGAEGSGSGSGSASGSGSGSGSPAFLYYDPYHPPPYLPYGYQPTSPYHPMYHPLPPAGLMPPEIPYGQGPGLQPASVYGGQ